MYRAFYSLAKRPFSKEIEPINMFASASYEEIMAPGFSKRQPGYGTGEAGSSKTSALRAFAAGLNSSLFKVAYFPLSTVTVNNFYRDWLFLWILRRHSVRWIYSGKIQEAITELFYGKRLPPYYFLMNCS